MDEADAALAAQIGANVRRLRLAAGLSLTELAAKATLSVPYLSRVEHGKRSVASVGTVKKIADVLGVPICRLIDPPTPPPARRPRRPQP